MSNVINLSSRKKNLDKEPEVIAVDIDLEKVEYIIAILTELADTGSCTLNDLAVAFVTLGEMVETLIPTFDQLIDEKKDEE